MLILTQSNDSYTNKMKWDPKNLPPNKINFSNDIRYILSSIWLILLTFSGCGIKLVTWYEHSANVWPMKTVKRMFWNGLGKKQVFNYQLRLAKKPRMSSSLSVLHLLQNKSRYLPNNLFGVVVNGYMLETYFIQESFTSKDRSRIQFYQ